MVGRRKGPRYFVRDHGAVSNLFGLVVGTGVFVVAFATVITVTQQDLYRAPLIERRLHVETEAVRLAAEIYGRPGTGWYASPCTGLLPVASSFQPDQVRRFGLASEPCPDAPPSSGLNLSHEKIRNIRSGNLGAIPLNGVVDYAEARSSLAVSDVEFRLTGRVVLPDALNVMSRGQLDPHLRPLYVGNYEKVSGVDAPQTSVPAEAAYLDAVVAGFQANAYHPAYGAASVPYAAGGDVAPDVKAALDAFLPSVLLAGGEPTLDVYNVMVVGSDVDQTALNSGATKAAIEDWVGAGGTLVVFGNQGQAFEWLQPFFHVGLRSASGPLEVLQPGHEILHVPNDLSLELYPDVPRAWDIAAQDLSAFDVVANRGGATLAASKEGVFGDGRVLLASYRPFDMTGQGPTGSCAPGALAPDCEGLRMMQNLLTMGYGAINFDYGPSPPTGVDTAVESRLATVWVPDLGQVEVAVWVLVF
jgi:hypothetical protein